MGLLQFFRRRGASDPAATEVTAGGEESSPEERAHGPGVPAGAAAEGPPVGVADPGSITGEDADEVVAQDEGDEVARP